MTMSTEHRQTERFSAYAAALQERFSSGILTELGLLGPPTKFTTLSDFRNSITWGSVT
ncbi:MAG: hypothetical protein NVS4B11_40150 [Ktedonobacteraceae bacterium]